MFIEALDAWYKAEGGDEKKRKSRAQDYVNALENILHTRRIADVYLDGARVDREALRARFTREPR